MKTKNVFKPATARELMKRRKLCVESRGVAVLWIPPKVLEKLKKKDGWVHFAVDGLTGGAEAFTIEFTGNRNRFFINGEQV